MYNIKLAAKAMLPRSLHSTLRGFYYRLKKVYYLAFGRAICQGETYKARARRLKEGFFEKYCRGNGIDIGYGGDLLTANCQGWDFEHGDAHTMKGLKAAQFDFVYSSHTLEHLTNPELALQNWWRILKPEGYLILYLPHRDLYEKRHRLPSQWNPDHKHFFLLDHDDPPDTLGIIPLIDRALENYKIVEAKICDAGHTITDPERHSDGEYSIEVVIKKLPDQRL